ncbi:MAG: hypothetical protein KF764_10565 [Labilithrix sp.]|nr:hypothetical protein [Labilithrix sp.]
MALGAGPLDVPEQRERLIYGRRRVARVEADEQRAALGELLDAVERVVDCIETGDHRALAVRALDAKVLQLRKLLACALGRRFDGSRMTTAR